MGDFDRSQVEREVEEEVEKMATQEIQQAQGGDLEEMTTQEVQKVEEEVEEMMSKEVQVMQHVG